MTGFLSRSEPAAGAHADALRGDVDRALYYAESLADAGQEGAWRAAILAAVWHADPRRGRLPEPAALRECAGADPAAMDAAAIACAHAERAAFLAFDGRAYASWLALHRDLVGEGDPRWVVGTCLGHVLGQGDSGAETDAERAELEASRAGLADTAVDAAVARAFFALARGDLADATRIARRAVRMARTEELPQQQYLAGLVLARVRRHAESPHLAVRILAALARVVPDSWSGVVRWELFLCAGGRELGTLDRVSGRHSIEPVIDALLAALRDAESGDHAGFDAGIDVARALAPTAAIERAIAELRVLVDPRVAVAEMPHELASWASGRVNPVPSGLVGIRSGAAPGAKEDLDDACIAVVPSGGARRVLGAGSGLAGPALETSRQGRIEAAIAVLALAASEGVTKEEFWERTYGFAYEPPIHAAALDALVHRLRELLGEAASLERRGAVFVLQARRPFVVSDPRCRRSLDDELLRVLARAGRGSARDAAMALDVPLRTVQLRLKHLAEEGACSIEKIGRAVSYRVEDTTFFEPTRQLGA